MFEDDGRIKTESNFIPCVCNLQLRMICHSIDYL